MKGPALKMAQIFGRMNYLESYSNM